MQVADKAYVELVDFFARGSTSEAILGFHPSSATQTRASYLLERNREGELTVEEAEELERFGELEHLMQLVKARARMYAESGS
jgi:hypothetical protein